MNLGRFGIWHYVFLGVAGIGGVASIATLAEYGEYPFLGQASLTWPSVEGKITSSYVSVHDSSMPSDDVRRKSYRASIKYTYVVDRTTYKGSTISFAPFGRHARKTVNKYRRGARVRVYYDPDDPETAVLEAGTTTATLVLLGGAAGFLVFVILFSISYVVVETLAERRRTRQNVEVCAALEEAGFKLKEWTYDTFGASLTADEVSPFETELLPFSLTEPPYGSFDMGTYYETISPQDVAMHEHEHHLVEIHNDGRTSFKRGRLLRIRVELPWTWFSDHDELKRPITLWDRDDNKGNVLQHICLGMRDDGDARWWAERWRKKPKVLVAGDEVKRLPVKDFTTGDAAFDGFFAQKVGGEHVREVLQGVGAGRQVVEPLQRWREILFEVRVTRVVEVWVDLKKIGWDELGEKLPSLAKDVVSFVMRLEDALGIS